jgi:hypothetical protein
MYNLFNNPGTKLVFLAIKDHDYGQGDIAYAIKTIFCTGEKKLAADARSGQRSFGL